MREVNAFVAEDTADFIDSLDPADHKPFEIKFQGDPQVELHIVGVDPGDERARVGAAVHRLQDRRLHLEEPSLMQVVADGLDHCRPDSGHPPGLRIDDQVHITVAYPGFCVTEPLVFFRQRPQALGGNRIAVGKNGQLTAAGGDHLTFHPDMVAEVHVPLPGRERLLTDPVQGDHDLDVAGPVADGGEGQLPAGPRQHHPAGDADPVAGVGVRLQIGVAGPDLGDGGGTRETDRIRVHALVQHRCRLPSRTRICSGTSSSSAGRRAILSGGGRAILNAILVHPSSVPSRS